MGGWRLGIATAVGTLLVAASAQAAGDSVVVQDSHVCRIFAFHGTIFYARGTPVGILYCRPAQSRPWMRIVNGRRRGAHGLPHNAQLGIHTQPIGLDSAGRVVVVFWTPSSNGQRWWTYDVAADTARRLRVPVPEGCTIVALALWRTRTAYIRQCERGGSPSGYFLRVGTHQRRLARFLPADAGLVTLGTTVAGVLGGDGDHVGVGLLSAHDRWCPRRPSGGSFQLADIWLAPGRVIWLTYDPPFYGDPKIPLGNAVFWTTALNGHCNLGPTTKLYDLPETLHAQAVAVDAPFLYYADNDAILRHLLSGL